MKSDKFEHEIKLFNLNMNLLIERDGELIIDTTSAELVTKQHHQAYRSLVNKKVDPDSLKELDEAIEVYLVCLKIAQRFEIALINEPLTDKSEDDETSEKRKIAKKRNKSVVEGLKDDIKNFERQKEIRRSVMRKKWYKRIFSRYIIIIVLTVIADRLVIDYWN